MATSILSKDVIVSSWLNAEIGSPRFSELIAKQFVGKEPRQAIEQMTPGERFKTLLRARPSLALFPWESVTWTERTIASREEWGMLRTGGINWLAFSSGTRLVKDAAEWISEQPADLDPHLHVTGIMQAIAEGKALEPVIAYRPQTYPAAVLWEGHARSMAYYLSDKTEYPMRIYLGTAVDDSLENFDNGLNLVEIRQSFLKEQA